MFLRSHLLCSMLTKATMTLVLHKRVREVECCMFLRSHLLCSMLTKAAMIFRTSQEGARGRVLHVPQKPSPVLHNRRQPVHKLCMSTVPPGRREWKYRVPVPDAAREVPEAGPI
ncbi:hypothetical protein J6590_058743 [Homalodisca vitripennis]|nr:hypothetical protein J6590_058743 [Homalodisca vitripennis]